MQQIKKYKARLNKRKKRTMQSSQNCASLSNTEEQLILFTLDYFLFFTLMITIHAYVLNVHRTMKRTSQGSQRIMHLLSPISNKSTYMDFSEHSNINSDIKENNWKKLHTLAYIRCINVHAIMWILWSTTL